MIKHRKRIITAVAAIAIGCTCYGVAKITDGKDNFPLSAYAEAEIPAAEIFTITDGRLTGVRDEHTDDESFIVPDSVTSVDGGAFSYCHNIKWLYLPSKLQSADLTDCNDITIYISDLESTETDECNRVLDLLNGIVSQDCVIVVSAQTYGALTVNPFESYNSVYNHLFYTFDLQFTANSDNWGGESVEEYGCSATVKKLGSKFVPESLKYEYEQIDGKEYWSLNGQFTLPSVIEDDGTVYGTNSVGWEYDSSVVDVDNFEIRENQIPETIKFTNSIDYVSEDGTLVAVNPQLTELRLFAGVKKISATALQGVNLNLLTVEDGSLLCEIEDGALSETIIANITADTDDNVKYLGKVAVGYASGTQPETVKDQTLSLYAGAFANCRMMQFTLPLSVKTVQSAAFSGCENLEQIQTVNVEYIGTGAFSGCTSLKSVILPESIKQFDLKGISNLTVYLPEFGQSDALQTLAQIKESVEESAIIVSDEEAFKRLTEAASLNSAYMGLRAQLFYETQLIFKISEDVWVSENKIIGFNNSCLSYICKTGAYGSTYWENDVNYSFPSFIVKTEEKDDTGAIEIIETKYGVDGKSWTYNGAVVDIKKFGISDVVTDNIEFTNEVLYKIIAGELTQINTSIEEIIIPNEVIQIGENAFAGCTLLKVLAFEDNSQLVALSGGVFEDCVNVECLTLPVNVASLANLFGGNVSESLKKIIISGGSVVGDSAFANSDKIEEVVFTAPYLTTISENAFSGCSSLGKVVFPDSLSVIGQNAFNGCPLKSIAMPSAIVSADLSCIENLTVYLPESYNAADMFNVIFAENGGVAQSAIVIAASSEEYQNNFSQYEQARNTLAPGSASRRQLFYVAQIEFNAISGDINVTRTEKKLGNKDIDNSLKYVIRTDKYGVEYWQLDEDYVLPVSVTGNGDVYGVDNTLWTYNDEKVEVDNFVLNFGVAAFYNEITRHSVELNLTETEKQFDNIAWSLPDEFESKLKIQSVNGDEGVTEAIDAGTYAVVIVPEDGYIWKDGTLEGKTVTLTVKPVILDLSDYSNLSWCTRGYEGGLADGVVYLYSEDGKDVPYLMPKKSDAVIGRNVEESIVWFRNMQLNVVLTAPEIPQSLGGGLKYTAVYENNCKDEVGVYTLSAKLKAHKNFAFNLVAESDLTSRGITITIDERDNTSATVLKKYYVVQNYNTILDEEGKAFSIEGWTFGNDASVSVPKLGYGTDAVELKFSLEMNNGTSVIHICTDKTVSDFAEYINASMPAGKYVLTFNYGEYTGNGEEELWWNDLTAEKDVIYAYGKNIYEFNIAAAAISLSALNEDILNYEYRYDGGENAHLMFDKFLKGLSGKVTTSCVTPEGWWEGKDFYSEGYSVTFNISSMSTDVYYAATDAELIGYIKPSATSTFTVYYQISARNHRNLTDIAERAEYSFTVVLYEVLERPRFTAPVYSGSVVYPVPEADSRYEAVWINPENYINGGTEYYFNVRLNDYVHYRWSEELETTGDNKENAVISFTIIQAENYWLEEPEISSWVYDADNGIPVAVPRYLDDGEEVEYTYIRSNEQHEILGEPVSTVPAAAGWYILRATVNETDNYLKLTSDRCFRILKVRNHWEEIPSVAQWTWGQFNSTVNVITARPAYINQGEEVSFGVFRDRSCTNAVTGLELFTSTGEVSEVLKNLDAGTYYLRAISLGSDNFSELDDVVSFTIQTVQNYWATSPYIVSWNYGEYDKDFNKIMAVAAYGAGSEKFSVYDSGKNVLRYTNNSGKEVTEFGLVNGIVPEYVAKVLKELSVGAYYLVVKVDGQATKYSALGGGNFDDVALPFNVSVGHNSWTAAPRISGWTKGCFNINVNFIKAMAKLGEVRFTVRDFTGKVVTSNVEGGEFDYSALENLDAGTYELCAAVAGTENYSELSATVIFTVRDDSAGVSGIFVAAMTFAVLDVVAAGVCIFMLILGRRKMQSRIRDIISKGLKSARESSEEVSDKNPE